MTLFYVLLAVVVIALMLGIGTLAFRRPATYLKLSKLTVICSTVVLGILALRSAALPHAFALASAFIKHSQLPEATPTFDALHVSIAWTMTIYAVLVTYLWALDWWAADILDDAKGLNRKPY